MPRRGISRWRPPGVLRRLDAAVLPPLGRVLARLARGGRRLRALRVAGVVLLIGVVLVAVYTAGRAPAADPAPDGATVYLGVDTGASIPRYVVTSDNKLQRLIFTSAGEAHPPQVYALASFSAYLTPDQLTPILAGLDLLMVNVIMRVPSDQQTEIVKVDATNASDIVRQMGAVAARKQQDAANFDTLARQTTGDTPDDRTLRATYRTGASVSRMEADAYRSLRACVYAAVVYATPGTLGLLAARARVRAVEPAPAGQLIDRAVVRPPFPDQKTVAEPPGVAAPSPSPSSR